MRRLGLVLAAAALAATGLALRVGLHDPDLSTAVDIARMTTPGLPDLLQRIRSFHRTITRDGAKVLEISAEEASYFRNDRAVVITLPRIVFYEKGEQIAAIRSASGRLYLDGTDVEALDLSGEVVLELAHFRLTAERIEYDRNTRRIHVPGPAAIESPEIRLAGTDLTIDMVELSLLMRSDVAMRLQASGS